MVASFSVETLEGAKELRARADVLRRRAVELAAEDERAYGAVLALKSGGDSTAALGEAARVPLRMVELAAELAPVLAELATGGKTALQGDALSGFRLLEGAASAAAGLVRIDTEGLPATEREQILRELGAAREEIRRASLLVAGR